MVLRNSVYSRHIYMQENTAPLKNIMMQFAHLKLMCNYLINFVYIAIAAKTTCQLANKCYLHSNPKATKLALMYEDMSILLLYCFKLNPTNKLKYYYLRCFKQLSLVSNLFLINSRMKTKQTFQHNYEVQTASLGANTS